MEKFNTVYAPGKRKEASRAKTPKPKLNLPVAPETGHNST
jgi:hypothetical protein